jgi:hypothetical protein
MRHELLAELNAIDLWDRLFAETAEPSQIEKDACKARFFRRVQVTMQLLAISRSCSNLIH